MPCSLTPASPLASRLCCDAAVRPSAQITASALATGLSGLYHTAWTLAVYASQPGLPTATQDSLPAAGKALPGRWPTCWVPLKGFRYWLASSFPRLDLAHNPSPFISFIPFKKQAEHRFLRIHI